METKRSILTDTVGRPTAKRVQSYATSVGPRANDLDHKKVGKRWSKRLREYFVREYKLMKLQLKRAKMELAILDQLLAVVRQVQITPEIESLVNSIDRYRHSYDGGLENQIDSRDARLATVREAERLKREYNIPYAVTARRNGISPAKLTAWRRAGNGPKRIRRRNNTP